MSIVTVTIDTNSGNKRSIESAGILARRLGHHGANVKSGGRDHVGNPVYQLVDGAHEVFASRLVRDANNMTYALLAKAAPDDVLIELAKDAIQHHESMNDGWGGKWGAKCANHIRWAAAEVGIILD